MHLLDFSLIFAITLVTAIDVERVTEDYSTLPSQREPEVLNWHMDECQVLDFGCSKFVRSLSSAASRHEAAALEAHPPPEHALIYCMYIVWTLITWYTPMVTGGIISF